MPDLPATLIATLVCSYWAIVLLKLAVVRWRQHKTGALVPRLSTERRIWPLWIAAIVAWHALPLFATIHWGTWYGLPNWALSVEILPIRWGAALVGLGCFVATVHCWIVMGRNWSVAVLPGQTKQLVTNGPFALVRHPIYALSILLMLCSVVAVPNLLLAVAAAVHITLMRRKAQIEEQFLAGEFGDAWQVYAARTGRFLPAARQPSWPAPTCSPAPHEPPTAGRNPRRAARGTEGPLGVTTTSAARPAPGWPESNGHWGVCW
jgi:protein-S-isoprenylcysteine O-methyltransferase Ste14